MYDFSKMTNRFNTNSYKWDVKENELPMWVADMDFETAPAIIDALHNRVDHKIFGYNTVPDDYFEAYQNWWERRHHFHMEKDWMMFVTGVVPAISSVVRKVTTVGENVLIMSPVYNIFYNSILNNGRHVLSSDLVFDGKEYHIDFEDFEDKIISEKVRLFILCSPHNPVGRVWTAEELVKLGDICVKHGVIVVSDEIHADFVFKGRHHVFASLKKEFENISITCTSPSKTFNLASMMMSNIFIPNHELKRKFRKELDAAGTSQLGIMGLVACEAAYCKGEEWYRSMIEYVRKNIEFTKEYIAENIPDVSMIDIEGTYLVWLDFHKTGLSAEELDRRIIHNAKLWLK